ncbi:hypothetical protein ARC20_01455 [Stenotrophomonas panacihumi]|uniref:DUF2884 family protein n=1 Tax=Stenotrophomonas panacihumi TaxID=676599 RepID=A0A0R0AGE5_9GAMM|nr:DUF2884 family protein [Stenotrophomonas panacihumi]KRG40436.1 hypothetical protein ARC20_01455 [Stenotrophomonas panacihumi]
MKRQRLPWLTLILLSLAGVASADAPHPRLSSQQCQFTTNYDLRIADDGVWLERETGAPREVHIHDGAIAIDQRTQDISADDARRLRRMEAMTRDLVPAVANIAREAVDIAFDALGGVVQIMTDSKAKARDVERVRKQAMAQIDASLGKGRWDQKQFDETFEANVERAAEDMAGTLTRSVLWAAFTGRASEIERRADAMEKDLDARMEVRSRKLEAQAQSLCDQVTALHDVQQQLDLRYQGQPLQLLVPKPADDKDDGARVAANPK